jgi:hypothetical protein
VKGYSKEGEALQRLQTNGWGDTARRDKRYKLLSFPYSYRLLAFFFRTDQKKIYVANKMVDANK